MHVYLHVGLPKTGSTALQRALAAAADTLREAGWLVPRTPGFGTMEHRRLSLFARDAAAAAEPREWAAFGAGFGDIESFRLWFSEAFYDEAANSGATALILSDEGLTPAAPHEMARLKGLLASLADTITIIIYLRRQDAYLLSEYSQQVKRGNTALAIDRWMNGAADRFCFDQKAVLDRWAAAFGRENLRIRLFERGALVGGSVVSDFRACLGLSAALLPEAPNTSAANVALDAPATAFMRRFNALYPLMEPRATPERHEALLNVTARGVGSDNDGTVLAPAPESLEAFQARWANGNAAVARAYLGRPDGVLYHEGVTGRQWVPDPGPDVDTAVDRAAAVHRAAETLEAQQGRSADRALADRLLASGAFAAAEPVLEGLVADGRAGVQTRMDLCACLLARGAPSAALSHARQAAANAPDSAAVQEQLTEAWVQERLAVVEAALDSGDAETGEGVARELFASHPGRAEAAYALSRALAARGQAAEACHAAGEAVRLAPHVFMYKRLWLQLATGGAEEA